MAGQTRCLPSTQRQSDQETTRGKYPTVSFSLSSLSRWLVLTWWVTLDTVSTTTNAFQGLARPSFTSTKRDISSNEEHILKVVKQQKKAFWRLSATSAQIISSCESSGTNHHIHNPLQVKSTDNRISTLSSDANSSFPLPQQLAPASTPPSRRISSTIPRHQGLSKYHQSILSRMASDRQRFVTGQYPIIATVKENPTLKWLAATGSNAAASSAQLWVNGTTVDRSLASYDRFQWLDERERRELYDKYLVSIELLAVIQLAKPGYINVLPGNGAGATASAWRYLEASTTARPWDRWKVATSGSGTVLEELEERVDRDRVWVTGFSLTNRGCLNSIDTDTGHIQSVNARTARALVWPNEVSAVPSHWFAKPSPQQHSDDSSTATTTGSSVNVRSTATSTTNASLKSEHQIKLKMQQQQKWKDAILVCDGFLVPGKDRGGVYVITKPGNPNNEWTVCLTQPIGYDRWFYHRALWLDLTGDGRLSILTARAKFPLGRNNGMKNSNHAHRLDGATSQVSGSGTTCGQLVCLEMPEPHGYDKATGTPLEKDGTIFDPLSPRHLPWKEHVLAEGPDVMFNVADFDPEDDTVEVIASQFFGEKVTLHSIQRGPTPKVTFQRTLDEKCGKAFGAILADLDEGKRLKLHDRIVVDAGCTVEILKPGDFFSHVLVTSHECSYLEEEKPQSGIIAHFQGNNLPEDIALKTLPKKRGAVIDGGSLFAYRVPEGKGKWKTGPWMRTTVASGFKVQGQLTNMINPGSPGFVYTFHARLEDKFAETKRRPLIAVAGDCSDSAYIFRPSDMTSEDDTFDSGYGEGDPNAQYDLMCEIKCGATVGSIGVGYGEFCSDLSGAEQESGYAKLYVPCYEKDKILVFALGSGEE